MRGIAIAFMVGVGYGQEICENGQCTRKPTLEDYQHMLETYPAEVSEDVEVKIGKYGPGLFAKNDIEPKTSLITLRNEDQITIEKAFEVFEGMDMRLDDTMDGIDLLALYLAIEKRKGKLSKYWSYISILPDSYPTVIEEWPEDYIHQLPYSFQEVYQTNVDDTKNRYERINKIFNPGAESKISFKEFKYAYMSVFTRYKLNNCPPSNTWPEWFDSSHDEGKCGALGPIFDMANHQNGHTNCDWEHEDGVSIVSVDTITAGDELVINYGHEGAIDILSLYGFTLKGNISPMKFTIPEMRRACEVTSGISKLFCSSRIDHFISLFGDFEMEPDCDFEEDFIPYLVGHNVFNSPDTMMAQKIRWNNFILYLLKIRYNEVSNLKDGLEDREDLDDPVYISMIKDIHKDQLDFISKCRSLFVVKLDDLSSKMRTY